MSGSHEINRLVDTAKGLSDEDFKKLERLLNIIKGFEGKPIARFTCEVLEDGRVTIPKRIREQQGIEKGSIVELGLIEVHSRLQEVEW